MTETPDPTTAINRALDAAQIATDAAHEAEAVLTARADATLRMDTMVRRTTWMAAVTGGASALVLIFGAGFWLRSAADQRDAAAVQASAAAAFVARLAEFNTALDRMDTALLIASERDTGLEAQLDQVSALLAERLPDPAIVTEDTRSPARPEAPEDAVIIRLDALRADLLAAIAEAELSMAERLIQLAEPLRGTPADTALQPRPIPPAATGQISGQSSGQSSGQAATIPATRPAARPPTARPPTAPPKPAPQPANPFRFP